MPLDVNCPKCTHVFPVTEAKHPFGVQCPGCDAELTAEFRKLPIPTPGQPHYELLVSIGRPPGGAGGQDGKKALALDDDEGGKKRRGGSMLMVFVAGIGALVVTLAGLGATGYVLFFTDFGREDDTAYYNSRSNTNTNNPRPTPNNPRPGGNNPRPGGNNPNPNPNPNPNDPFNPPKKADKFDYRPVAGAIPPITPPQNLPAETASLEIDLQGRAGAVAVAGGGRYVAVHLPERGLIGLFDSAQGKMTAAADTERGEVRLAGGANRVVAVFEGGGAKKLQSFSLPDLRKEFETTIDMFFPPQGVALGNRTNGPALVWDPFGEVFLYELGPTGAKEVEGARKKTNPGIHAGSVKAFPDGTGFAAYDTHNLQSIRLLTHDTAKRDWKVDSTRSTPFASADGLLYGKGVVNDKFGKDARFTGVGSNAWFVPATTGGNYFLKLAPLAPAPKGRRPPLTVTFHSNRNAAAPLPGSPIISGTPELEGFGDFNGNYQDHVGPPDQFFYLIPEAKMLVVMNTQRTKLTLRKVELK